MSTRGCVYRTFSLALTFLLVSNLVFFPVSTYAQVASGTVYQVVGDVSPATQQSTGANFTVETASVSLGGQATSTSFSVTLGQLQFTVNEDTDNDGIRNNIECPTGPIFSNANCVDSDNDGTADFLDTDSDGDGIPDSTEGSRDTDGDGIPDYLDQDSDNDGLPDSTDPNRLDDSNGTPGTNSQDTDGDGILDTQECLGGAPCPDTDGDDIPDHRDTDSDGDGLLDSAEGTTDTDGDGIPNYLDRDSDNDGILDATDPSPTNDSNGTPGTLSDFDGDGLTDNAECPHGYRCVDSDGDGIPDYADTDSDNDGTADNTDTHPTDAINGTATSTTDSDNDGIPDQTEQAGTNGGDGNGDGIPDHIQGNIATFPNTQATGTITLKTSGGCSVVQSAQSRAESNFGTDASYEYPLGLVDFNLQCFGTTGVESSIDVYYSQTYDTSSWVFRKYINGSFQTVTDLVTVLSPEARAESYAIPSGSSQGTNVTVIRYLVKDGDGLDGDNTTNGTILDPFGPAVLQTTTITTNSSANGSTRYVCRDENALNYERYGINDDRMCEYKEEEEVATEEETPTVPVVVVEEEEQPTTPIIITPTDNYYPPVESPEQPTTPVQKEEPTPDFETDTGEIAGNGSIAIYNIQDNDFGTVPYLDFNEDYQDGHPYALVNGVVTDEDGDPLANQRIILTKEGNNQQIFITTNSEGVYQFAVPRGDYSIRVSITGFLPYQQDLRIDDYDLYPTNIVVERPTREEPDPQPEQPQEPEEPTIIPTQGPCSWTWTGFWYCWWWPIPFIILFLIICYLIYIIIKNPREEEEEYTS